MNQNHISFEGTLRNGGLDKDFYRQISQIEGDQPQSSDVGKISDIYNNNPMPEYSYKESNYGDVSNYHSNGGGYDRYYKNNPFEMPKNPLEMSKNEYELDDQDKELFKSFSNDEGNQHPSSDNSDLYSMIGKKVILDFLKHRNGSQVQSEENLKQDFLKKIMGGNSDQKETGMDKLFVNKMSTTTLSPNSLIGHFPTLPSSGNVFTSGKVSPKEALTLDSQQTTQSVNLPKGINLSIQGHVFHEDPRAPPRLIKEQAPTVRQLSPSAAEIQEKLKTIELQPEKASLSNQLQTKEEDSKKENYVTLKISGSGKPVSFKAGTSDDGSLVLKIPANVTLMDSSTNKDTPGDVILNQNGDDSLKSKMATDTDQMTRYLWASQKIPWQEFAKKENMIEGNDDGPSKEMLSWQILGKTNSKLNQDETENTFPNDMFQGNHKVASSARPTQARALNGLYILPTAVHDLSQLTPTKYNELSRVSFTGVGKSPPSQLFPAGLRIRQNVDNNKFLSLKSFLRPSKFIEDSPVNRAKLSTGPVHNLVNEPSREIWGQG